MPDMLSHLRALPDNIHGGVVANGNIGPGIVFQVDVTPGMECVAIADIHIDRLLFLVLYDFKSHPLSFFAAVPNGPSW